MALAATSRRFRYALCGILQAVSAETLSRAARMTGPAGPSLRTRLPGPVRNPQVVPGRIEDPEVLHAPRPVLQILRQRPSRRRHPVALSNDVVNFEHQLHPRGGPPDSSVSANGASLVLHAAVYHRWWTWARMRWS